ncbi:MAG: GDP-mannose 4,6 dehydratase, partial [Subtercola sp.]|nr:GDP-mannose 4,6 dehydratase [Subtercola sp.]MCU1483137.1 GDP-mannose 4,6 dehydratase [Subtercola sp.]
IGSSAKAERVLGWKPKVDFGQLVTMMVENDVIEQKALARL